MDQTRPDQIKTDTISLLPDPTRSLKIKIKWNIILQDQSKSCQLNWGPNISDQRHYTIKYPQRSYHNTRVNLISLEILPDLQKDQTDPVQWDRDPLGPFRSDHTKQDCKRSFRIPPDPFRSFKIRPDPIGSFQILQDQTRPNRILSDPSGSDQTQ